MRRRTFIGVLISSCRILLSRRGGKKVLTLGTVVLLVWLTGVMVLPKLLPHQTKVRMLHRRIHQQQDVGTGDVYHVVNNSTKSVDSKIFSPLGVKKHLVESNYRKYNRIRGRSRNEEDRKFPVPYPMDERDLDPFWPKKTKRLVSVLVGAENIIENGAPNEVENYLNTEGEFNDDVDLKEKVNVVNDNFLRLNNNPFGDNNESVVKATNNESEEGPYTLPILRTPKKGPKAMKKPSGYLAKLQAVNAMASLGQTDLANQTPLVENKEEEEENKEEEGQQEGQGEVVEVPFNGHGRGAFRGNRGVFPVRSRQVVDVPKTVARISEGRDRILMMAMAAVQHGQKITDQQRKMLDSMSPERREVIRKKTEEMQQRREKAYFAQLQARGQLVTLPGGGQKILSISRVTIRFPSTLKKMQPESWSQHNKIYLNVSHQPWENSPECKEFRTEFLAPHSVSSRAVASFPSSGNTWVRYLLEGATGVYTGSLYDDSSLIRKGMYGEAVPYDSGLTLLQKTHGYTTGEYMLMDHQNRLEHNHFDELNCQGVVIIRNPFKALISHRHLDIGGHTGYAPRSQFEGKGWWEFVGIKIKLWEEFYSDWLTHCPNDRVFVTHYELLKSDLKTELLKVLDYLELAPDHGRLSCVSRYSAGLFKRKPSKNLPPNIIYYPRRLKDTIYQAIYRLNRVLVENGKSELPVQSYEMFDDREYEIANGEEEEIANGEEIADDGQEEEMILGRRSQ